MPSQRKHTLQEQGVPIPDTLRGPQGRVTPNRFADRPTVRGPAARSPGRPRGEASSSSGEPAGPGPAARLDAPGGLSGPKPGGSAGVGMLAGEFFLAIGLLILLFFAKSSDGLPQRIMNTIKRGTLICAAFFILALVAGAGPNASKIAKAIGALLLVAILLTTPIYGTNASGDPSGVLVDVDNIIKNDWAPSATHSNASSSSTPSGTNPSTPGQSISSLAQALAQALKRQAALQGQKTSPNNNPVSKQSLATDAGNAAVQLLNGVVPGSGTALGKLFGFLWIVFPG